jgi:hypothetical protein
MCDVAALREFPMFSKIQYIMGVAQKVTTADSSFLSILSFNIIEGDPVLCSTCRLSIYSTMSLAMFVHWLMPSRKLAIRLSG